MALGERPPLVFVPPIGFRPAGTRTLREHAETTADNTKLMVLAVAAAPDRTDVVIEWERTGDPATCPPDSQLLVHSNMAPLEDGLTAALVLGASRLNAITMRRRAYHMSHGFIGAVDALTFPALPGEADASELHVSEGAYEWRVPFTVVPCQVNATALAVEVTREGIVVRATALSRYEDEVIVELEVEGAQQIRQVGSPVPTPLRFSSTSEDDHRARTQEHRRFFGERAQPITLEDEHGARGEEVRRLFSPDPQQAALGQSFINRFSVVFEAPSADAQSATLLVPFVDLNDFEPSVTADLHDVPLDLALGAHRFRVISAEPYDNDQRRVVLEVTPSASLPRFMHPARMHGAEPSKFSWRPEPWTGHTVWMATAVGDPPIVTFTGAVLRVDGPLRLELPLI